LGCTHYPFLRTEIEAYMGSDVPVIDSGLAIALRTRHVLNESGLLTTDLGVGNLALMTSASVAEVEPVAQLLLGETVTVASIPVTSLVLDRR
jgi:glutamate racemase